MKRFLAALVILGALPLGSQTVVRLGAGMTGGTDFVKDFIAEEIGVRQSLAPTITAAALATLGSGHRIGLEVRVARGNQELTEGGETSEIGSLTTIGISILADGRFRGAFRWEAALGMLAYRPEGETGVFSQGGPSPLLLGGGVSWHREVATNLQLVLGARYDFHAFTTTRLLRDSYGGHQAVHRGGVTIALERGL